LRVPVIIASLALNLFLVTAVIADEFTALESRIDSQLYELLTEKWDTNKTKMVKELVEAKMAIENVRIARINIQTAEPKVGVAYNRMKAPVVEVEKINIEQRKQAEANVSKWRADLEAKRKAGVPVNLPGSKEAAREFNR
jgi:hypothetical protein